MLDAATLTISQFASKSVSSRKARKQKMSVLLHAVQPQDPEPRL